MTEQISFPTPHELPRDEFEMRKQHLLSEIAGEPRKARLPLPTFTPLRARTMVIASAAIGLAAGAAALSIVLSGGSPAEASILHLQPIHGPNWRPAARAGTGVLPLTVTVPSSSESSAAPKTGVVGGTPSEEALVQEIISGMQPTVINQIEITGNGNDVALHFSAPSDTWARTIWEEGLVAGAFRDRADAKGGDMNVSVFGGDANGASVPPGPATPLPAASSDDASSAKQLFESAAAKIGVSFDELTIYQPDGIAIAAAIQTNDPASFLTNQMPTFLAALGDRWNNFDGTYISLLDGSGQTVWETSTNGRTSSGSVGSSPDLAGCSPVANWSGFTTPSCPSH